VAQPLPLTAACASSSPKSSFHFISSRLQGNLLQTLDTAEACPGASKSELAGYTLLPGALVFFHARIAAVWAVLQLRLCGIG